MVQLRENVDKLRNAGVQVVGVSYDSVETLRKFSEAEEIPFPLLSDEGSKTIRAYGLHFEKGLPHPGTVLVDQQRRIRAKLFREGYQDRHDVGELVAAADGIDADR